MKTYSKEALDELVAKDEDSKRIYASYKEFSDNIKQWAGISEKQYYESIMS